MATRRYAERTTVGVETSIAELRRILTGAGSTHFAYFDGPDGGAVQFSIGGLHYRFEVERPKADVLKAGYQRHSGMRYAHDIDWRARADAEWRRRWRARVLWVKVQVEFAADDPDELPRSMMAFLVLPDGRTFERWALPQIEAAYADGTMPPLLGAGS